MKNYTKGQQMAKMALHSSTACYLKTKVTEDIKILL